MALKANSAPQTEREIPKAGAYIARIYQVLDMGTPVKPNAYGKRPHGVQLGFELPTTKMKPMDDGTVRPFALFRTYSLSTTKTQAGICSALRKIIQAAMGRDVTKAEEKDGFDVKLLLGKPVQIVVVHNESKTNDNVYANIDSVVPLMDGVTVPDPHNKPVYLELTKEGFDPEAFESLPPFLQDKIREVQEYQALGLDGSGDEEDGTCASTPAEFKRLLDGIAASGASDALIASTLKAFGVANRGDLPVDAVDGFLLELDANVPEGDQ